MKCAAGRRRRRRRRVACATRCRHRPSRRQTTALQGLRLRLGLAKPQLASSARRVLVMCRVGCRVNRFHGDRRRQTQMQFANSQMSPKT